MIDWQRLKLRDLVEINYGKNLPEFKRITGQIPVYSSAGLTGWHNAPLVNSRGIIIGRKGTIGTVYYSDSPFFCIDTTYFIKPNDSKYDLRFLYYLLGTIGLEELNEDSAVPGLNRDTMYDQDVLVPPLSKQRTIAAVLSSLDDKIALLHRQNKTLESLASALWRKIFVEDASTKWKKGRLSDEMSITMGQSPEGTSYNEDGRGEIFFQGRAEFGFRYPQERLYCSEPKRFAKKYDTLVSVRAPVGDINMAMKDCCIGRGLAAVRHKKGFISYTFYKMHSLREEFDSFDQQGTVFGSIGKDDFYNIETGLPGEDLVDSFENLVKPIDDGIFNNSLQIHSLSRLRNSLLTGLISGEVEINI